ncbi:MAG: ATP-binding cassette domain-containing protein, partial [Clostridiaceae bacterium]|nr:ATP-binding cassette domain-containing protein [Clostridiaceae bacterium]
MGWIDQQLKNRAKADQEAFCQAFEGMAGVVMDRIPGDPDDVRQAQNAIEDILKYFGHSAIELPENITDLNDQLDYLLRPTGIMWRMVRLEKGWQKDSVGPLLAQTTDGRPMALLPDKLGGYYYFDRSQGKRIHFSEKYAGEFTNEALCFYRPLPLRKLGVKDLLLFIVQALNVADLIYIVLATLAVTLVGLVMPYVNNILFSTVLESGQVSLLLAALNLLVGTTIVNVILSIVKSLVMSRIQTKMSLAVEAASMMRVLSLPASFFRDYSSGELSSRVQTINSLCSMLVEAALGTGLSSIFSIGYIAQVFRYAPALVIPALSIVLLTFIVTVAATFYQMHIAKALMEASAVEGGRIYSLFSAVQKIKLSGAERRSFAQWASSYIDLAKLKYRPPFLLQISGVITLSISLVGTVFLYYSAVKSGVSPSDYMSFTVAYGLFSGAFVALSANASTVARIKSTFEMSKPLLLTAPETLPDKKILSRISGNVEISNVSFRYTEDMPYVLDNLSLRVRAGQYLAIVGPTGCGKSTLVRLLLGFETPEKGAVYYDGYDISTVDVASLRRNIGCVIQNGKLFQGSIFSNIVVTAPWLGLKEAEEAAELAGIAEDIRQMPMGMHTIISEGSGGISGGQKQRLLIARAVAPKPRLLILDEATSALDNITQKRVSDALAALRCTRIVIAHRLSTIKQCDRIIVLNQGGIAE